jgi:NTP pyrophosphatase (non-canonical NTP hydrolase)
MSDLNDLLRRTEQIREKYDELNALNGRETWRIRDYAMGFVGDVGDLMKLVLAKENILDKPDVDDRLAHELADCMYSILILSEHYGVDLSREFEKKLETITQKVQDKHV